MTLTESLIAFTFAATLLTLTPGLDTALILRTATVEGSKKAFHAAFGINVGCLIWGAMVAFGLGTLIAASELAYNILKWCGAAYLCWLGLQMILKPRTELVMAAPQGAPKQQNWFLRGMLGNVLNPKNRRVLRFIPAAVYPCRTFSGAVDLSACSYSCLYRHAVVVHADCRHASVVAFFAPRFRSEVDGPNDRRYLFGIRRASGFVSAVS